MVHELFIEGAEHDISGALLADELNTASESLGLSTNVTPSQIRVFFRVTVSGIKAADAEALIKLLSDDSVRVYKELPSDFPSVFALALRAGTRDPLSDTVMKLLIMKSPELAPRIRVCTVRLYAVGGNNHKNIAAVLRAKLISTGELCELPKSDTESEFSALFDGEKYPTENGDEHQTERAPSIDIDENPDLSEPFITEKTAESARAHIRSQAEMTERNTLKNQSGERTEFGSLSPSGLRERLREMGLGMDADDAIATQGYFLSQSREPTEMELHIINRFRSERRLHSSVNTVIESPVIDDPNVRAAFEKYSENAEELGLNQPVTIANIAKTPLLSFNATDKADRLVAINEQRSGITFRSDSGEHVLLFSQESNNTRSSIDPSGGASACLGDAIRRSMRFLSHPYDLIRVSGIASPDIPNGTETDEGSSAETERESLDIQSKKADFQRSISLKACDSFSDYARTVGLPCSNSAEYVNEDFRYKHLELSAVLSTIERNDIKAEAEPTPGDIIMLIGSRTGRDGRCYLRYLGEIAKKYLPSGSDAENELSAEDFLPDDTGNFRSHFCEEQRNEIVRIETLAARNGISLFGEPVPNGDAVEQKKLMKLFQDEEFIKLPLKIRAIDSSGITVAASALSDSVVLYLDCVPLKYNGLSALDVAVSETCERFLIAVKPENVAAVAKCCERAGVISSTVGSVTDDHHLSIYGGGKRLAYITSDFLNHGSSDKRVTANVRRAEPLPVSEPLRIATQQIESWSKMRRKLFGGDKKADYITALKKAAQSPAFKRRSLDRRLDCSLGGGSVLSPLDEGFASAAVTEIRNKNGTLMLEGEALCSAVTVGLLPDISTADPYKGAYFAVTEALGRMVAAGFDAAETHLSIHQFYPSYKKEPLYMGNALSAIIGVYDAQRELGTQSLSGNYSFGSGSSVTETSPNVAVFGISIGKRSSALNSSFKHPKSKLVLLAPTLEKNGIPVSEEQLEIFETVNTLLKSKSAYSALSLTGISAAEAVLLMCFGSKLGFVFDDSVTPERLFELRYGAMAVELDPDAELPRGAVILGSVSEKPEITVADRQVSLDELTDICGYSEPFTGEKLSEQISEIFEKNKPRSFSYLGTDNLHTPTALLANRKMAKQIATSYKNTAKNGDEEPAALSAESTKRTTVSAPAVALPTKILLPSFSGSVGDDVLAERLNHLCGDGSFTVEALRVGFDKESLSAFASAISNAGMLCLPDGTDLPAVIASIIKSPDVSKSIAALRKQGGLIYGVGSGFTALISAGLLGKDVPAGAYADFVESDYRHPVTGDKLPDGYVSIIGNPLSGNTRKNVLLRVSSARSPFMQLTQCGEIYSTLISTSEGRLIGNEDTLRRAGRAGMIASQYCDKDGRGSASPDCNPCASMLAIDSLSSFDGTVFGQISHPERAEERAEPHKKAFPALPVLASAIKYLKS